MNNFKILKISYPGIIALKPNTWFNFKLNDIEFAISIQNISKGLKVFDPHNEILSNSNGPYKIKNSNIEITKPNYILTPEGVNQNIEFRSIVEIDLDKAKSFFDEPYTELILLVRDNGEKTTNEEVSSYLNILFVYYSSNHNSSSLLKPDKKYWTDSSVVYECRLQHKSAYEEIINGYMDWDLEFKPVSLFIGFSKYGILPPKNEFINSDSEFNSIPEKYFDVFELFSSGVMHLNHYKNSKIAILETFVALEVLVVRVTDEQKSRRGISKRKISEFKQVIDLAHRMDIELKIFFTFSKEEQQLIGQMVRARKIRNNIMHNNQMVDENEISKIVSQIREFLFMLISKHENS
ncbi:hypothetical protein MG296_14365 [Flavobacteriaceae bacterium TK19130]|nr:hypothetical protein [Thermobacterium salinum]